MIYSNFIKKYQNLLPVEAIRELEEIAMKHKYLEKVFNNSPCTISIVNEHGIYLNANDKMLKLLNKSFDELIGQKVGELTKDSKIALMIEDLKKEGVQDKFDCIETIIDGQTKNFWITINKTGPNFLVIGSDVTDFKSLEREKEFSDKMAFLGEMSSFIVHEINNPLMTINMASEIIQMNSDNNKDIQEQAEMIENMVSVISKIISSLKSFSRKEDDSGEFNLKDLVEKTILILSGKLKKASVHIVQENIEDITLKGNEIEFLQVLVNLVSNSIDASKNFPEKWVKIRWEEETLKVIDCGSGIPEYIIPNLFKKFFTSKGNKGNGIGLFLSREILNKYGYNLVYKLEENHTSFQCIFKKSS